MNSYLDIMNMLPALMIANFQVFDTRISDVQNDTKHSKTSFYHWSLPLIT